MIYFTQATSTIFASNNLTKGQDGCSTTYNVGFNDVIRFCTTILTRNEEIWICFDVAHGITGEIFLEISEITITGKDPTCTVIPGGANWDCGAVVDPTTETCAAATMSGSKAKSKNQCVFKRPATGVATYTYRDDEARSLKLEDVVKVDGASTSDNIAVSADTIGLLNNLWTVIAPLTGSTFAFEATENIFINYDNEDRSLNDGKYTASTSSKKMEGSAFTPNWRCDRCLGGTFQELPGKDACKFCPSGQFGCTNCTDTSYHWSPQQRS